MTRLMLNDRGSAGERSRASSPEDVATASSIKDGNVTVESRSSTMRQDTERLFSVLV